MLNEQLKWRFTSRHPVAQGLWRLLPRHVLNGVSMCLDRETAGKLWESPDRLANTICGVESGIIVATEERWHREMIYTSGIFAHAIEDGRPLWKRHGSGRSWIVGRLLDLIPGQSLKYRDSPTEIRDGRVFCHSGAVLNLHTGQVEVPPSSSGYESCPKPKGIDDLYLDLREPTRIHTDTGITISLWSPEYPHGQQMWELVAESQDEAVLWRLSGEDLGKHLDCDLKPCQVTPRYVYFAVSDVPPDRPEGEMYPVNWYVLTIDVRTGTILQEVPFYDINDVFMIEDVDEQGLLVSPSQVELTYFERKT